MKDKIGEILSRAIYDSKYQDLTKGYQDHVDGIRQAIWKEVLKLELENDGVICIEDLKRLILGGKDEEN